MKGTVHSLPLVAYIPCLPELTASLIPESITTLTLVLASDYPPPNPGGTFLFFHSSTFSTLSPQLLWEYTLLLFLPFSRSPVPFHISSSTHSSNTGDPFRPLRALRVLQLLGGGWLGNSSQSRPYVKPQGLELVLSPSRTPFQGSYLPNVQLCESACGHLLLGKHRL